jgi:hypothetical protein
MRRHILTIPQFCRLAGINRNSGYQAAKRNELPVRTIRVGKRILIPRRAAEDIFGVDAVAMILGEAQSTEHITIPSGASLPHGAIHE